MKSNIFLAIAVLGLLWSAEVFSAEAKEGDDGRYQLFQGTYTTFDLKRQQTSTSSAIFLIDTRTGKVKRYVNRVDEDGKYVEIWLPTETAVEKK